MCCHVRRPLLNWNFPDPLKFSRDRWPFFRSEESSVYLESDGDLLLHGDFFRRFGVDSSIVYWLILHLYLFNVQEKL